MGKCFLSPLTSSRISSFGACVLIVQPLLLVSHGSVCVARRAARIQMASHSMEVIPWDDRLLWQDRIADARHRGRAAWMEWAAGNCRVRVGHAALDGLETIMML